MYPVNDCPRTNLLAKLSEKPEVTGGALHILDIEIEPEAIPLTPSSQEVFAAVATYQMTNYSLDLLDAWSIYVNDKISELKTLCVDARFLEIEDFDQLVTGVLELYLKVNLRALNDDCCIDIYNRLSFDVIQKEVDALIHRVPTTLQLLKNVQNTCSQFRTQQAKQSFTEGKKPLIKACAILSFEVTSAFNLIKEILSLPNPASYLLKPLDSFSAVPRVSLIKPENTSQILGEMCKFLRFAHRSFARGAVAGVISAEIRFNSLSDYLEQFTHIKLTFEHLILIDLAIDQEISTLWKSQARVQQDIEDVTQGKLTHAQWCQRNRIRVVKEKTPEVFKLVLEQCFIELGLALSIKTNIRSAFELAKLSWVQMDRSSRRQIFWAYEHLLNGRLQPVLEANKSSSSLISNHHLSDVVDDLNRLFDKYQMEFEQQFTELESSRIVPIIQSLESSFKGPKTNIGMFFDHLKATFGYCALTDSFLKDLQGLNQKVAGQIHSLSQVPECSLEQVVELEEALSKAYNIHSILAHFLMAFNLGRLVLDPSVQISRTMEMEEIIRILSCDFREEFLEVIAIIQNRGNFSEVPDEGDSKVEESLLSISEVQEDATFTQFENKKTIEPSVGTAKKTKKFTPKSALTQIHINYEKRKQGLLKDCTTNSSVSEILDALSDLGIVPKRQKGSHLILGDEEDETNLRHVTVPTNRGSKGQKPGTFHGIEKQVEELLKARSKLRS